MTNVSSEETITKAQVTTTMDSDQLAQNIKDIAKRIREESARMRDTVQVICQSGALEELTDAIREATMAARDTSREVSEAARILKERGVIRDTAAIVDDTARNAVETAQIVKVMSKDTREAAPETAAVIAGASETAKEHLEDVAEKKTKEVVRETTEKGKRKSKK